jgi:hypothetical protein
MADLFTDLVETAKEKGSEAVAELLNRESITYFGPSSEPLEWDTKGVVKVSDVVMSMHLIAARVGLRSVPQLLRGRLVKIIEAGTAWLALRAAGAALALVIRRLLLVISEVAGIWTKATLESEMERMIRDNVLAVRRDLLSRRMKPKKNRVRKTKLVKSRNPKTKRHGN